MEEMREGGEFQQGLADGAWVEGLVFELPGVGVRQEDGVQARGERGIDVGFGAVADHPCRGGVAAMVGGEGAVGGFVCLGEDVYAGEVFGEAGALELGS